MKKALLTILLAVSSLTAYSQSGGTIITKFTSIQRMIWSDIDDKHLFFDLEKRYSDINVWQMNFNENHSGVIKMTSSKTDEVYAFNIYNWEIRTNNYGEDYIWVDVLQVSDSQRCTILINSYDEGKMISIFMPESQLCMFFDNLNR